MDGVSVARCVPNKEAPELISPVLVVKREVKSDVT